MHADPQRQWFIGSVPYSEHRETRAHKVQCKVGNLTRMTVAISTRNATYHHVWVADSFHLEIIILFISMKHDDVIKWKRFPRYCPFVRGIHRSPVNPPHEGQWHGALMFSLIGAWINSWVNNRETADLRRRRTHYDAIVMGPFKWF